MSSVLKVISREIFQMSATILSFILQCHSQLSTNMYSDFLNATRRACIVSKGLLFTAILRLSERSTKVHARTRPKGGWVSTSILRINLEGKYKFVFLHVENLLSSQEAFICSFTFTVACL